MKSRRIAAVIVVIICIAVLLFGVRQHRRMNNPLERGQCTWYAVERAHEAGWNIRFDHPYGRHARAWCERVVNAEQGPEPRVGAIMVIDAWPGNPYGHVAYVESVAGPNRWTISHANFHVGETTTVLQGIQIFRAECERTAEGVKLGTLKQPFRLRGFLYPKNDRV
jgi:surface antigen